MTARERLAVELRLLRRASQHVDYCRSRNRRARAEAYDYYRQCQCAVMHAEDALAREEKGEAA